MADSKNNSDGTYRPMQNNFINKNRKITHNLFICIFAVVAVASGLTFLVNYSQNSKPIRSEWEHEHNMWFLYRFRKILKNYAVGSLDAYLDRSSENPWRQIACLAPSVGVLMLCFLLLIRWIPKVGVFFGIFVICILTVLCAIMLYFDIKIMPTYLKDFIDNSEDIYGQVFFMAHNTFYLILLLTLIVNCCIWQAGISNIADIIREALRVMFFFPSLILFGILILILNLCVVYFVYSSAWYTVQYKSLYYISTFGGVYLYLCIYYFGRMVISQTIAIWHATENKDEIPKFSLLRSITVVFRFHLGVVFFAATLILPVIVAIVVVSRHKFYAAPKSGNRLVEIILKIFLTFNIADYTSIIMSVHGCNLFQATKKTFQLMIKKCSLSLAVINIFHFVLIIGIIISIVTYGFLAYQIYTLNLPFIYDPAFNFLRATINMTMTLFISLTVHVTIIANSAVHTILLFTIEDEEKNDESKVESQGIPLNEML